MSEVLSIVPESRINSGKFARLIPVLAFLIFVFVTHFLNKEAWLPTLAYAIFAFEVLSFLLYFGQRLVILRVISLLAAGQWAFFPVAANDFIGYNILAVKEEVYLAFVVPGVALLILGLNLFRKKYQHLEFSIFESAKLHLQQNPQLGLYLFAVGWVGGILKTIAPIQLAFFFYLLSHLMFVGGIYALFSPSKNKLVIIGLVFLLTLAEVVATGMFGEFVFWLGLILIVTLLGKHIPFWLKVVGFSIACFSLLVIQSVKWEYRDKTWGNEQAAGSGLLLSLIADKVATPETLFSPIAMAGILERGNMGFHIGMTMKHVPKKEPFAKGETIFVATVGSLLPRFVWPDKPKAGGQEKMRRFAGYKVRGTTSMNIGPLAEGYANFGKVGGWIYIFLYGTAISWLFSQLILQARTHPTLIFWIPFIFLQVVKVETDLTTVLNHALKAVFFAWLVYGVGKKIFKVNL